jgi:6-phosphogluconolactonase
MQNAVKIFQSPFELAEAFAQNLMERIGKSAEQKENFSLALSGGKTPEILFSVISDHFSESAPWEKVHFFWSDERCVPGDDDESNYGMARRKLLDHLKISPGNIHRIRGEENPVYEAGRYSDEVVKYTRKINGLPSFDMIILGLGDDGHTASIFPGQEYLLNSDKICEIAFHPVTKQKRLTLTGNIIRNARNIAFIVTGAKKAPVIEKIMNNSAEANLYPAAFIIPFEGDLQWFIDKEAGSKLEMEQIFQ